MDFIQILKLCLVSKDLFLVLYEMLTQHHRRLDKTYRPKNEGFRGRCLESEDCGKRCIFHQRHYSIHEYETAAAQILDIMKYRHPSHARLLSFPQVAPKLAAASHVVYLDDNGHLLRTIRTDVIKLADSRGMTAHVRLDSPSKVSRGRKDRARDSKGLQSSFAIGDSSDSYYGDSESIDEVSWVSCTNASDSKEDPSSLATWQTPMSKVNTNNLTEKVEALTNSVNLLKHRILVLERSNKALSGEMEGMERNLRQDSVGAAKGEDHKPAG